MISSPVPTPVSFGNYGAAYRAPPKFTVRLSEQDKYILRVKELGVMDYLHLFYGGLIHLRDISVPFLLGGGTLYLLFFYHRYGQYLFSRVRLIYNH